MLLIDFIWNFLLVNDLYESFKYLCIILGFWFEKLSFVYVFKVFIIELNCFKLLFKIVFNMYIDVEIVFLFKFFIICCLSFFCCLVVKRSLESIL